MTIRTRTRTTTSRRSEPLGPECRRRLTLQVVLVLALLLGAAPAYATESHQASSPDAHVAGGAGGLGLETPIAAEPLLYFSETGFGIDETTFADYFLRRGGVPTFGFPTSRTVQLLGLPTQFFQRRVLQIGPDGGVRPLNLLDPGLLSYTRINGSTFPAPDERLAAAAPLASQPNYAAAVVEFVRRNAPETYNGQPVRFFSTFNGSVTVADAFPRGGGDPQLLPLLNLEIWGVPTSAPAQDPNNGNFIYQRFQRGIMHYDAGCRCTQGLLLADYFKSLITGDDLPADLEEQARTSPFLHQYSPDAPSGLSRPGALPNSDLRGAFARQAPPIAVAAVVSGPQARVRVEQSLAAAIDALDRADELDALNALAQSDTEVAFGDLPTSVHAKYTRIGMGPRRAPARSIVVNNRWRDSDPKALATIIAHEAKHLQDDLAGYDVRTSEGCVQFEVRAFTEQALVWQGFYGAGGKVRPQDELEEELNAWLALYRRSPAELERRVRQLYTRACL